MKKFLLVLLVLVFLPSLSVHGQIVMVADAVVQGYFQDSILEDILYYATMVSDNITQIEHFVTMIKNMEEQAKRTIQNLGSAKDINSWSDFMDWYNRQLYLERKTAETFDSMNVTIGKKQFHFTDIEGIAYGVKSTYVDFWEQEELTEEQRREMWLSLGLTPSNYAYVQPFREKARQLRKQGLTAPTIANEEYMRDMELNKGMQDKMAEDKNKKDDDKMGSKEITMMILESLLSSNRVLNNMAMNQAIQMEKDAVDGYLDDAPADSPATSEWDEKDVRPLKK